MPAVYHLKEGPFYYYFRVFFFSFFSRSESVKEVICKLCQVVVQSTQELRLHMQTARHKDREDELAKVAQPGS